ncbi:MAG: DNA mismatch repair endonuclease MutL [Chlamydiota bacterium]|nr:DNA mismatch repair endonuclease MutL [Chlamydiota bacterium]
MSAKIRVLDEHTINQIAAGEVIENPSSVVKELVDNSIDSGAKEITIEIKGGGRQLIRITDDGCGMSFDDAVLSFERHATSKISSVNDINDLYSMGFRGEAVPSIASISKYTLLTRLQGTEGDGTMVIVDGGRIIKACAAACSYGTTVEVKSLFFNVPVRRKFQRSPNYDAHEILKMLTKLALANPEIKFELISNQKSILLAKRPATDDAKEQIGDRTADVIGREFVDQSAYVDHMHRGYEIRGFIGLPAYTKHNRSGQYIFINKRPVFSPLIHNAIREGFGTTLPTNRHPQFILHITMPGDLVDINVHPQKKEVRLRQESDLKKAVCQAVDQALHVSGIAPVTYVDSPVLNTSEQFSPTESFAGFSLNPDTFTMPRPSTIPSGFTKPEISVYEEPVVAVAEEKVDKEEQIELIPEPKKQVNIPRVQTTIQGYILLETSEGLSLVDQKAAHSRVVFEKLRRQKEESSIEVQALLVPYTLELTPQEASALSVVVDNLNRIGIQIKEFGGNTYIIDAVPTIFGDIDVPAFATEMVQGILEGGDGDQKRELEKRIASIASRVSVSGKVKLSFMEAQHLIEQLFQCDQPQMCPKGKSTIITIGNAELAQRFLRK